MSSVKTFLLFRAMAVALLCPVCGLEENFLNLSEAGVEGLERLCWFNQQDGLARVRSQQHQAQGQFSYQGNWNVPIRVR
jgi:hypothetical protein